MQRGSAERFYHPLYCERGQAENRVKMHKAQFASNRTSCCAPLEIRLGPHTAPYWLTLGVGDAVPRKHALART